MSCVAGFSGVLSLGVAAEAPPKSEEAGFTLVAAKESSGGSPPPLLVFLSCADTDTGAGAGEPNEKGLEELVVFGAPNEKPPNEVVVLSLLSEVGAPNEKPDAGVGFLSCVGAGFSGVLSLGVAAEAVPTREEAGFTLVAAKESSGGSPPPLLVFLSCAGADDGAGEPNEKGLEELVDCDEPNEKPPNEVVVFFSLSSEGGAPNEKPDAGGDVFCSGLSCLSAALGVGFVGFSMKHSEHVAPVFSASQHGHFHLSPLSFV